MPPITYQQTGVDPEKAAKILNDFGRYLKTRPQDPRSLSGIGPFAACFSIKDLVLAMEDPTLVSCCDGVGTKALLAQEWGALEGLGQDLVAMNVNDLLCVGASPLVFLDYYACGALDEAQLSTLLRSIQTGCELAGCTLAGGETAEMPGLYRDGHFDLAGFCVGIADRPHLLGPSRVREGDVLVAIASSGAHSNGYSLIRRLVERAGLTPDSKPEFSHQSWKEVLLAPTTIYTRLLGGWTARLHALAHLTGGGLFENLPRVLPAGSRARIQGWEFPPLFQWLQAQSGLSTAQMLGTFNCGVGLLAVCPSATAEALVRHCHLAGVAAWTTGQVEMTALSGSPEVVWE